MDIEKILHEFDLPLPTVTNISVGVVVSIIFWLITYNLFEEFYKFFFKNNVTYLKLSLEDKKDLYGSWNSLLHGIFSSLLSLYGIFYTCEKLGENVFNSDVCFNNPRNKMNYLCVCTVGYLIADFSNLKYIHKEALRKQFLFHHLISIYGALNGPYYGHSLLTMTVVTCLTETSTVFLNLRSILSYHSC